MIDSNDLADFQNEGPLKELPRDEIFRDVVSGGTLGKGDLW